MIIQRFGVFIHREEQLYAPEHFIIHQIDVAMECERSECFTRNALGVHSLIDISAETRGKSCKYVIRRKVGEGEPAAANSLLSGRTGPKPQNRLFRKLRDPCVRRHRDFQIVTTAITSRKAQSAITRDGFLRP